MMKLKMRIAIAGSVLTIFLSLYFQFFHSDKNENQINVSVCTSEICRAESARFLKNANITTDPCTNFYEHACGNFLEEYKHAGHNYITNFILLELDINNTLYDDLSSQIKSKDPVAMAAIKLFYQECTEISGDNRKPILEYITSLGGWPLIEKSNSNLDTNSVQINLDKNSAKPSRLYRTIIRMREAGKWINEPFEITSNYAADFIEIRPLHSLTYKGKDFRIVFNEISKIAHFLGGDNLSIVDQLYEMLDLDTEIRKNFEKTKFQSTRGKLYTMRDLKHNFPGINWEILLQHGRPKSDKEHVMVYNILQTEKISDLMPAYEDAFTNFIIWRTISDYTDFVAREMNFWKISNSSNLSVDEIKVVREKLCYDMCFETIGLNAFFVSKYVKKGRKEVKTMYSAIEKVAETFFQSIAANDERALNSILQLKSLRTMIGHTEFLAHEDIIDAFYRLIAYKKKNLFKFYMDMQKTDEMIRTHLSQKITDSFLEIRDQIRVAHPEARYKEAPHALLIPAGVLNLPFYHRARPNYLNFGGIGYVLGYETAHATGYRNAKKENCLISRYSKYRLSKINKSVNGTLTLPENWANYWGTRFAYDAYKAWKAKQTEEEHRLVHFKNYTSEQMFWMSAAGIFCEHGKNEFFEKIILSGGSLGEVQVNVGFANNADFARDFNCPLGSPMNPRLKC